MEVECQRGRTATRSGRNAVVGAPLEKHSPGGCAIDMPPLNCAVVNRSRIAKLMRSVINRHARITDSDSMTRNQPINSRYRRYVMH